MKFVSTYLHEMEMESQDSRVRDAVKCCCTQLNLCVGSGDDDERTMATKASLIRRRASKRNLSLSLPLHSFIIGFVSINIKSDIQSTTTTTHEWIIANLWSIFRRLSSFIFDVEREFVWIRQLARVNTYFLGCRVQPSIARNWSEFSHERTKQKLKINHRMEDSNVSADACGVPNCIVLCNLLIYSFWKCMINLFLSTSKSIWQISRFPLNWTFRTMHVIIELESP